MMSLMDIVAQDIHVNHQELLVLMKYYYSTANGTAPPWDPECETAKCMTLIGDAGDGKTSAVRNFCKIMDWEFRIWPTGSVLEEDNLPVANMQDTKNSKHFSTRAPAWFPSEKPKGGFGILFIDEIFTATEMQQNQIAILISQGYKEGFAGHRIAEGWWLAAATNPPSDNYYLSKEPDERLQRRLWPIVLRPSVDDTMRYFQDHDKVPDILYRFLMNNPRFLSSSSREVRTKGDKKSSEPSVALKRIDNRTWEDVGGMIREMMDARAHSALLETFLTTRLGPEVAGSFMEYTIKGDDPYFYPIPAMKWLSAGKDEHAGHLRLLNKWTKDAKGDRQATIGATVMDMYRHTCRQDKTYGDKEMGNLVDMLLNISADSAAHLLKGLEGTPIETNEAFRSRLIGTKLAKDLASLEDAQFGQDTR